MISHMREKDLMYVCANNMHNSERTCGTLLNAVCIVCILPVGWLPHVQLHDRSHMKGIH